MSQITVLDKNNAPTGPFTRAEIAQKLQHGEIALTDLAYVEGLNEWTPLQQVLAKVDSTPLPGFVPPPQPVFKAASPAPVATAPMAGAPMTPAPVAPAPAYSYAATMAPPSHLVYAGFWLRFVAHLLDGFILGVVVGVLMFMFFFILGLFGVATAMVHGGSFDDSGQTQVSAGMVVVIILAEMLFCAGIVAVVWVYYAKLESGPAQGTFGKQILGLKVTDMTGARVGFGRATGRFFGKIISGMTLCVGYIMAGLTERKQALHDMIAGTLVVRK